MTLIAGDCHHTVSSSLPSATAGQSAALSQALRARARGRAGSTWHHHRGLHSSPASRPHHSGPGPAAGAGTGSGHLPQPADRLSSVGTHYLRVSQTGHQTSADRQVWGTDSDTSRRRSDRRSGTTARDTDLAGPDDSAW